MWKAHSQQVRILQETLLRTSEEAKKRENKGSEGEQKGNNGSGTHSDTEQILARPEIYKIVQLLRNTPYLL